MDLFQVYAGFTPLSRNFCFGPVKRFDFGLHFSVESGYTQSLSYFYAPKGSGNVPNIKSVKKDVIKSRKNHLRNVSAKSAMKTFIKKAKLAVETPTVEAAPTAEAVRIACKTIDKTAQRGIIHKNQASRRKSRLMKRAHVMSLQAAA